MHANSLQSSCFVLCLKFLVTMQILCAAVSNWLPFSVIFSDVSIFGSFQLATIKLQHCTNVMTYSVVLCVAHLQTLRQF